MELGQRLMIAFEKSTAQVVAGACEIEKASPKLAMMKSLLFMLFPYKPI
jgi:hypothetical protein